MINILNMAVQYENNKFGHFNVARHNDPVLCHLTGREIWV